MLFLDKTSFDPENSMELFKRWEKAEKVDLNGLRIVSQWFDAGGGRVITLYDVETVKDYVTYNLPFADLCQVEVFPVLEAGEFKKFAASYVVNSGSKETLHWNSNQLNFSQPLLSHYKTIDNIRSMHLKFFSFLV